MSRANAVPTPYEAAYRETFDAAYPEAIAVGQAAERARCTAILAIPGALDRLAFTAAVIRSGVDAEAAKGFFSASEDSTVASWEAAFGLRA